MEGWVDLGYPAMHRLGVEPAISRSQVQSPNHYATEQPVRNGKLDIWLLCEQGLYRLAEMVEGGAGFVMSNNSLSLLQVPAAAAANNVSLVLHLYSR